MGGWRRTLRKRSTTPRGLCYGGTASRKPPPSGIDFIDTKGPELLLNLVAPTRPPVQALAPWRGRGRDDDRFEHEAHRASAKISSGHRLEPGELTPTSGASAGLKGVHPKISGAIEGARGSGRRLAPSLQRSLSASFGADLRDVRVHTDARAHGLNERLNARAFTSGRDVFFRRGAFDPSSSRGSDVLNHELTHVVQQCGRGSGGALRRAERPTIQRFLMQVGKDDEYTRPMREKLAQAHKDEDLLKFNAVWDSTWTGGTFGEYDPVKTKYHKDVGFSRSTSRKLKGVPNGEPLRIIAHGNIRGMVGGYTAPRMFALLSRLGLPATHTGGIDIHACLPASPYTEERSDEVKQPHIVQLQDLLGADGRHDVVRGYVHTITPATGGGSDVEVSSRAYKLFTDVYKPLFALIRNPAPYVLNDGQIQTIRSVMGGDGAAFLKAHVDSNNTIKKSYDAYLVIRHWMVDQGHLFDKARLRRAESVRLR